MPALSRFALFMSCAAMMIAFTMPPAQAYSSTQKQTMPLLPDVGPLDQDTETAAPPVAAPAPAAAVKAPAPAPAKTAAPVAPAPPPDPCADYANSAENYGLCQIQVARIKRMLDARDQRERGDAPPATEAAPAAPAAPAKTSAPKTAAEK